MRAMVASGTVPSTMVGRIRWLQAERHAPASSANQQSTVMKPDHGSMKNASLMRPDTGVHPSATENTRITISPHQKIGMEAPVTDTPISP